MIHHQKYSFQKVSLISFTKNESGLPKPVLVRLNPLVSSLLGIHIRNQPFCSHVGSVMGEGRRGCPVCSCHPRQMSLSFLGKPLKVFPYRASMGIVASVSAILCSLPTLSQCYIRILHVRRLQQTMKLWGWLCWFRGNR